MSLIPLAMPHGCAKKISSHTYLGEDYINDQRSTYEFSDASFDLGAESPYRGVIVIYNWNNNTTNSGAWCDIEPHGESAVRLTKQESATRSESGVTIFFGMVPTGSTFDVSVYTDFVSNNQPARASCCVYKVETACGSMAVRRDKEDTDSNGSTSITLALHNARVDDLIITGVLNEKSTTSLSASGAGTEDLDVARPDRFRSGAYSDIGTGTEKIISITGGSDDQIQVSVSFYAE